MQALPSKQLQKVEFYTIFINNLFLIAGIAFMGWTLFETLILFWLEPLAALLIRLYIQLILPLKNGRPGTFYLKPYRKNLWTFTGMGIYTLIMQYIALLIIFQVSSIDYSSNYHLFDNLKTLLLQIWNADLVLLSILLISVYLLPPVLMARKNGSIKMNQLSMQIRVMVHPSQFILNYILFFLLLLSYLYLLESQIMQLASIMVLKSIFEALLFKKIQMQD